MSFLNPNYPFKAFNTEHADEIKRSLLTYVAAIGVGMLASWIAGASLETAFTCSVVLLLAAHVVRIGQLRKGAEVNLETRHVIIIVLGALFCLFSLSMAYGSALSSGAGWAKARQVNAGVLLTAFFSTWIDFLIVAWLQKSGRARSS